MPDHTDLAALKAENARLIALLEAHGIDWRRTPDPTLSIQDLEPTRFSTHEKVALGSPLNRSHSESARVFAFGSADGHGEHPPNRHGSPIWARVECPWRPYSTQVRLSGEPRLPQWLPYRTSLHD